MYPSALVSRPHSITDVVDDADGESLQATLVRMLEPEENYNDFQSLSNISQVLSGNEHGLPVISGSHLQNLRRPNYVCDPDDFFEEKDLVAPEYFDPEPEALLREPAPSTQVQATVSASRGSHQARIQQPCSGPPGGSSSSNCNNKNKNPLVMKIVVSVSVLPAAACVEELPNDGMKKYFCFM